MFKVKRSTICALGAGIALLSSSSSAFTASRGLAFHRSSSSTTRSSTSTTSLSMSETEERVYTIPDQPARFARAKAENNERYLNIESVYDPSFIKGKRVALTGANRGIGLALAKELTKVGAKVVAIGRSSSPELEALNPDENIVGIDVTDDEVCEGIAGQIKGGPIDILISNAGYFWEQFENLENMNFKEELKQIDICAIGPLRVFTSLYKGGLIQEGAKVAMITSQGGSVAWRPTQNGDDGGDYGHHMSKSAANMGSVLLAQEVKKKGIAVGILHPGFNKTGMTAKYAHIWEIEGAVDPSVGAMRVIYEIGNISLETSGKFINCEDGLEIPW